MPEAVNLAEKLALFTEHWSPKIVTTYNDNDIMVVKFDGEFPMHNHPETDDFFLVLDGHITIETEDGNVDLRPGELYVVPRGVMHRPIAHGEAKVLLIEPQGAPNSGDPATAATKVRI
ncbi:MAG: cupin domain-containing protein [Salaquimonas sp.]|jgi:mannose-6-phosphate isomerase-like protein (cupin superfamily)|nr:cupin domain-containing protein [Salaquimonas sp.]